jgi:putative aminopeptidase FrvX
VLLEELSNLNGVSGREDEVRSYIYKKAVEQSDEVFFDSMGSLIAVKGRKKSGPSIMLAAHMDEVGLMVTGIDNSGMLKIDPVGSMDARVLVSKPVTVGKDRVAGVIGAKPIHLQERDEQRKPLPMRSLFVDIGAKDKGDAEKAVRLGDAIAFDTKASSFGQGCFKGKALDDRAGCAVLMRLMEMDFDVPVYFAFTAQEEIGARGAKTAAYSIQPSMALVFEGTSAGDVPEAPEHKQSTRLGQGPAVTFMDRSVVVHRGLFRRIREVADSEGIRHQLRQMTTGGTDAGPISRSHSGVPTGIISVPCRYIHSPVSVLKLSDFEDTVRLASAVLRSVAERGLPSE